MTPLRSVLRALIVAVLFSPMVSYGHGGRTDSSGGHTDRKTGVYHYHGGGGASQMQTAPVQPLVTPRRTTQSRTSARTSARTSSRQESGVNSLLADPERVEPEIPRNLAGQAEVAAPAEKRTPVFKIIDSQQRNGKLVTRVQLDDVAGTPRPSVEDLNEIIGQLSLQGEILIEFVWIRGRYQHVPWASSTYDEKRPTNTKIHQDALDFDILSERIFGENNKCLNDAAIHPYRDVYPSSREIRELFDDMKIAGDCRVRFFWAGDDEMKHPTAAVSRDERRPEPQVVLFPRAGARRP
jgi:hypothetical protein